MHDSFIKYMEMFVHTSTVFCLAPFDDQAHDVVKCCDANATRIHKVNDEQSMATNEHSASQREIIHNSMDCFDTIAVFPLHKHSAHFLLE